MRPAIARATIVALLGSLLGIGSSAPVVAGATTEVSVDDYVFEPDRTGVSVGDSVHWLTDPEALSEHNVREEGAIFRSGDESLSVDYTVTFSAGTFNYFCEPHLGWDMVGVVGVPATVSAAPAGLPFTVRWATSETDSGRKFDVSYRVGGGPWKVWKHSTTGLKGVFGKGGKPVAVRAGRAYSFKVRSRGSGAVSAWSPVVSFRP